MNRMTKMAKTTEIIKSRAQCATEPKTERFAGTAALVLGAALTAEGVSCSSIFCFLYNFGVGYQYHSHTRWLAKQVLPLLTIGLIAFAAAPAGYVAHASKLPGGTWASIAQLPDMNGFWEMTFGGRRGAGATPDQQPSLTPK